MDNSLQVEMFPELDLQNCIMDYGHATPEQFADFIVRNMERIPKKRGMVNCFSLLNVKSLSQKRKADQSREGKRLSDTAYSDG